MEVSKEVKLGFTLKELSISCRTEDVPSSSSTVELRDTRLVCVEYPAVVKHVDKMLETLGDEETVSKVSAPNYTTSTNMTVPATFTVSWLLQFTLLLFSAVYPQTFAHPNRRLELHFRPQDPFCHSLYGNRFSSSNLLLRVRRRVRKNNPQDAEIRTDVLGVIGTTYKFQGYVKRVQIYRIGPCDDIHSSIIMHLKWKQLNDINKRVRLTAPVFVFCRAGRLSVSGCTFRKWRKHIFIRQDHPPQTRESSVLWAANALLSSSGHLFTARQSCGLLLQAWRPAPQCNTWVSKATRSLS